MSENSITQLPVIDDGNSVGSIAESRVLAKLLENQELLDAKVSEVMSPGFPTVEVDAPISEVRAHLRKSPAVLVEEFKRVTSIITRVDLLDLQ